MKIHFYGGAEMVTGANYLIEVGNEKILVDCGLRQGSNAVEKTNINPFFLLITIGDNYSS